MAMIYVPVPRKEVDHGRGIATRSSRGHRTICVPIEEEDYLRIIHDPKAFAAPLMIVSVRPLSCSR